MTSDVQQTADDVRAITQLPFKYARALDSPDFELLREVYAMDAVVQYHGMPVPQSTIEGLETIIGLLHAMGTLRTQHVITNHEFVVEGDRANGYCYLLAQHWRTDLPGELYMIGGRYDEAYVKTEAGWRVARRDAHQMWAQGNLDVLAGL